MKNLNYICNNIEFVESKILIPYKQALEIMEDRVTLIKSNKQKEMVWFLEHPSIYTSVSGNFIKESFINNIPD